MLKWDALKRFVFIGLNSEFSGVTWYIRATTVCLTFPFLPLFCRGVFFYVNACQFFDGGGGGLSLLALRRLQGKFLSFCGMRLKMHCPEKINVLVKIDYFLRSFVLLSAVSTQKRGFTSSICHARAS